jgi:hypothetical protein
MVNVSPSRRKSITVRSSSRPATVVPLRFSERMGSQPAAFSAAIWIERSWSTVLALAYPTLAPRTLALRGATVSGDPLSSTAAPEALAVQSRELVDWIEFESSGFDCPSFADELVGCEAFEGLQSRSEIVGADEVGEMPAELIMAVVVVRG